MDLSIVIPNYNTKKLLHECIESIYHSHTAFSKVEKFEIIVVDNASSDGSVSMIKKNFPDVLVIENEQNVGYGKANNQGIDRAKGEYILLLNSDAFALGSAIGKLYMFAKEQTKSFIGAKLYNPDKTPQTSCGPSFSLFNIFLMLYMKGDTLRLTRYSPDRIQTVDWVSGACMIAKKKDFVGVGLFDEGIFMYMDEVEFLYRAKQKGYAVLFYPDAAFIHKGAASSNGKRTPVVNIYRGITYFYNKHYGLFSQYIVRCLLIGKARISLAIARLTGDTTLYRTYEKALSVVKK